MSSHTGLSEDASASRPGSGGPRTLRIAALGERERVRGFGFAGVQLAAAEDADAARAAWRSLPGDVGLVILTQAAHAALVVELAEQEQRLWVVMPA